MSGEDEMRRKRYISQFPLAQHSHGSPYQTFDFHPKVLEIAETDYDILSKIVVVGDISVGKTCLVKRFCQNKFEKDYKATIGVDFEVEQFQILRSSFKIQIWDTAGQERFKSIAAAYYRKANAVIVVFDCSDSASLFHSETWKEEAVRYGQLQNPLVFLVGTKNDLIVGSALEDNISMALQMAQQLNAEFWCVSSKTGEGVTDLFYRIAVLLFEASILKESISILIQPKIGTLKLKESKKRPIRKLKNCC